jgi:hypothetical protein
MDQSMTDELLVNVVVGGLALMGFIHFAKYFLMDVGAHWRWFKKWSRTL